MKNLVVFFSIVLLAANTSYGKILHGWKGGVHLAAVPIIAATGIYSDVRILQDARDNGTKAGAITNLGLLAVQSGLGATVFFGNDEQSPVVRVIHRIVGSCVVASALWISIEGSLDKGVPQATRYTSYGHTVFAAAPLILFTF